MTYEEKKKILIDYCRMKFEEQDWHGVRDCCVDIEVLDARECGVKSVTQLELNLNTNVSATSSSELGTINGQKHDQYDIVRYYP